MFDTQPRLERESEARARALGLPYRESPGGVVLRVWAPGNRDAAGRFAMGGYASRAGLSLWVAGWDSFTLPGEAQQPSAGGGWKVPTGSQQSWAPHYGGASPAVLSPWSDDAGVPVWVEPWARLGPDILHDVVSRGALALDVSQLNPSRFVAV